MQQGFVVKIIARDNILKQMCKENVQSINVENYCMYICVCVFSEGGNMLFAVIRSIKV